MNIPAEFNEIRPYTPEELPQIYEELIADPGIPKSVLLRTIMGFSEKNSQRTDIRLFRLVRLNPELHFHLQSSWYYSGLGFSIYPTDRQRNDNRRDRHRRQPAHLPMDS